MAGITYAGTLWNTTAGNKTVTLTPAVGDLLVAICSSSGRTAAQPPTVTCNVQGFTTFTRHATGYTKNTSADSGWVFVADSLCTVASSTIVTMTQASDSGGGLVVYRISGMARAGLDAIRQIGKQDNQAAATPSVVMGVAILTTNPVLGLVNNTTNGSTTTAPPTGWAEDVDTGYTTPANGRESCSRASGETLTTIPWTGASASAFGSIIVELDASVRATDAYDNMIVAETGIVTYLSMAEASGIFLRDLVGGHHGTIVAYGGGSFTLAQAGIPAGGSSVRLTCASAFVGAGITLAGTTFALGDGPWTYEIWLKRASIQARWSALFSQGGAGTPYVELAGDTDDTVAAGEQAGGAAGRSSVPVTDTTTFHHFAFTKTTGDVWLVYQDGVDVTTASVARSTVTAAQAVYIGAWLGTQDSPDAYIARAAIYNVVLTPDRVLAHAGGKTPRLSPYNQLLAQ